MSDLVWLRTLATQDTTGVRPGVYRSACRKAVAALEAKDAEIAGLRQTIDFDAKALAKAMTEIEMTDQPVEYIVSIERSAGNAEVGEVWTETAIFPGDAILATVAGWVSERCRQGYRSESNLGQGRVTLQIAQRPTR